MLPVTYWSCVVYLFCWHWQIKKQIACIRPLSVMLRTSGHEPTSPFVLNLVNFSATNIICLCFLLKRNTTPVWSVPLLMIHDVSGVLLIVFYIINRHCLICFLSPHSLLSQTVLLHFSGIKSSKLVYLFSGI